MKKIGIITVYKTENIGSVLQSTALKNVVEAMGYSVLFISTKNKYSVHSRKQLAKSIAKAVIRRNRICNCWMRYRYYEHYIKNTFQTIQPERVPFEGLEKIIIGSDTVWDVGSKYFEESSRTFWTLDWMNIPVVTYAVTIGNTSYRTLNGLQYPEEAIKQYQAVSVRDRYTARYVEAKTGRAVPVVCDPTFLLPVEYYRGKCFKVEGKYLLLYLFDELAEHAKKDIRRFAAERGLRIVSLGKHILGSDQWVSGTIENFLSYFNCAEYIVTNTFHGTIFSILFNKAFVSLDCTKNKVTDLLQGFSLSGRLTSDNILAVLEQKIDYNQVNNQISEMRNRSMQFLVQKLAGVGRLEEKQE